MNQTVYPGCTPDFRLLERSDGVRVLQIRQVNHTYGYVSKWQDVPIVKENEIVAKDE